MSLWTAWYQSSSFCPYKWTLHHIAIHLYPPFHFCEELFITIVYATGASHCVSSSVRGKVPYSLLVSEFFRCLQAQWKLLPMDWGTRQLVFTRVIDRWAQESGLWPYWCLVLAPTWCLMSNETASCLTPHVDLCETFVLVCIDCAYGKLNMMLLQNMCMHILSFSEY